ncbi:unnamed protein product [Nippostrongylus brasiliensis]|uniref:SCP domain-containing protein n=1 Tax=Nippostrongylus brasiliensis TaxID=27835 RepID=A0A0N4XT49_NIPBR|nr:unnamed protein product [Nippostrongylus brasiliensis]
MYSIAILCLLPVIAAYSPFKGPCGLSYEEGQIYKKYADRVKYGLIASCNLFKMAQDAVDSGIEPDLENDMMYWVTKSTPYTGNRLFMAVLKEVDYRVKTYGCAYSLEYGANGKNTFHVGCLFSRNTYYYP